MTPVVILLKEGVVVGSWPCAGLGCEVEVAVELEV